MGEYVKTKFLVKNTFGKKQLTFLSCFRSFKRLGVSHFLASVYLKVGWWWGQGGYHISCLPTHPCIRRFPPKKRKKSEETEVRVNGPRKETEREEEEEHICEFRN